jgi:hypothetical protein
MRKPKSFKLKAFEIKRGYWKYREELLTEIKIEKDSQIFEGAEEVYGDLDSVKIGKGIYDIEKCEEGRVYLTEPCTEDFEGFAMYEWSLPIIIRNGMEQTTMMLDCEADMPKGVKKVTPLSRLDKQSKLMWMKVIQEDKGSTDIDSSTIGITTYDEVTENVSKIKNNLLKMLVELAIYIDMDYKLDNGKDLWTELGIKKDNYVALSQTLSKPEVGILADEEQILKLKLTIEAIKNGEKDVDLFVAKKMTEADIIKKLAEIRKGFETEEEYQNFVKITLDNMSKGGVDTNEGTELQHTDN